jgi:hypothetical protein
MVGKIQFNGEAQKVELCGNVPYVASRRQSGITYCVEFL